MREVIISVVVPVYGCSVCLESLYLRLKKTLGVISNDFEILLINDASPDNSWEIIKQLSQIDDRVKGINLSRNFGQHYAIAAGLDFAVGQWVVVMDCDLQDKPEEIIKLYEKALEGYEQVVAVRENRKDSLGVRVTSKLFYVIFNYLSDSTLDSRVANFGIYSSKVIDNIKRYKEKDRSFGLLASLTGFSRTQVNVEHAERPEGESSYNFRSRMSMAIDHILSHSNKPLFVAIKTGFVCSLFSGIYAFWLMLRYVFWSQSVAGWTSVMVSLFFLSGLIVCVIGVVGIYIGKIYNEVKERPLYIVDDLTFK